MPGLDANVVRGRVDDLGAGQQPTRLFSGRAERLDADVTDIRPPPQELDEVRAVTATEIDDAKLSLYLRRGPIDQLQAVQLRGVPGREQTPGQIMNPKAEGSKVERVEIASFPTQEVLPRD